MAARSGAESPKVTLARIAAEAGVSAATVSKVLNGRTDVSAATRKDVQELLAAHNYVKSSGARRAGLIDILFTQLHSPWAVEIIRGADEAARPARCGITVSSMQGSDADQRAWLDAVAARRPDGVILVLSNLPRAYRQRLASLGIPLIMVDPVGEPDELIPSIGATNWAGGLAATEHLIRLGHRRIATITGPPATLCSQARLDGYRAALERAEIPADPAYVRAGNFHHPGAMQEALTLLELSDPPTAIFAASDEQALGVYEAARQLGLQIPDDLSVVGFDDVPMAGWVAPPLTTIRQPLSEMAALATRTLLSDAGTRRPGNRRIELSTKLIVRTSTAPPPARRRVRRPR
jgi:DNA-binding LacI/PurR family transcriptional regulator